MERKISADAASSSPVKQLSSTPPHKPDTPTKRGLSEPRRRLVRLMRDVYFGRIEQLVVRNGEPVFEPCPRVVREIKIGGDNELDPERAGGDFLLKTQVRQFFLELLRLDNAVIERIEVKHGLPFRVIVETPLAGDGDEKGAA